MENHKSVITGNIEGHLTVWDLGSSKKLFSRKVFRDSIVDAKFSLSNNFLFVASDDGKMKLYKINRQRGLKLIKATRQPDCLISSVLLLDHLGLLLISGKYEISIWDIKTFQRKDKITAVVSNFIYIPKYNCVAVSLDTGWVKLYDIRTTKTMGSIEAARTEGTLSFTYAGMIY